jgi:His/Glu/Gln/Arg/opine family amino acid ABC transporter permease subunit
VVGLLLAVVKDLGLLPVRFSVSASIAVIRAAPQLVLLYLVFFGLPSLGIDVDALLTAILVLGIAEGCFNAELYRASFVTVPASQRDAGLSLGLSHFAVLRRVVIPQALQYMIAPLLNSFVSLLKTATLASAIGVPEVLYHGMNDVERTGNLVLVVLIVVMVYAVFTMPILRLVDVYERRSGRRLRT